MACVNDFLQSLSPEPDFTSADFRNAITPLGLRSRSKELDARMSRRLWVNDLSARALAELGLKKLIQDASAVAPLIQCLSHPWLEVSKHCERALMAATRHSYGWDFFHTQSAPLTEQARQAAIAEWVNWHRHMRFGRPIFDQGLEAGVLAAVREVERELARILGGVPASYLLGELERTKSLAVGWGKSAEEIYAYGVGNNSAANWPGTSEVDLVEISVSRPGFGAPRAPAPTAYQERFPKLDLEVRVVVETRNKALREDCRAAVRRALQPLRLMAK